MPCSQTTPRSITTSCVRFLLEPVQVQLGSLRYSNETSAVKDDGYLEPKDLDETVSELHIPHSVRSSPSFLKYKQFTSVLRLKAISDVSLVGRFVFPDGHLVIVLLQADWRILGLRCCRRLSGPRDRLGWLRGLGRHESRHHQASSGSLRLPTTKRSRCDRAGWKAVVKFWVATLGPSTSSLCSLKFQELQFDSRLRTPRRRDRPTLLDIRLSRPRVPSRSGSGAA